MINEEVEVDPYWWLIHEFHLLMKLIKKKMRIMIMKIMKMVMNVSIRKSLK